MLITNEIRGLIDAGALIVANHSGGKDSQILLVELLKVVPRSQILVVHACLGPMEWPGAMELARRQATDAGLPFVVAKAEKTLLDMVERRFASRPGVPSWPSPSTRQCTSDLKRGPIEREVRRYAKANGFTIVINCLGLRAGESDSRAKRSTFARSERNSVAGRAWYDWLPVHQLHTLEVFCGIADAGLDLHHAYQQGSERLSCVFCIMGSRNDLRLGAEQHPELLDRYVELEQRTGYTMHASRRPLAELAAAVN